MKSTLRQFGVQVVRVPLRGWIGFLACLVSMNAGCGVRSDEPAANAQHDDGTGPLDALSRRFGSVHDRMRERNFGNAAVRTRVFVGADHGTVVPLVLPIQTCSTVVALAGGAIQGLSLALYDPHGVTLGAAQRRREGALLHVCPQESEDMHRGRPHYLVLEAEGGSGAVIYGVFGSAPGQAESFTGVFEGLLAPDVPRRQVERRLLRQRARALRDRGMSSVGAPMVKAAALGETLRLSVSLLADDCYAVISASDSEVRDLDLEVYDPAGISVARNMAHDAEPTLEFCAEVSGPYVVVARVFEGAGVVGLATLLGASSLATEDTSQPDQADVEAAGLAARQGFAPPSIQRQTARLSERGYLGPEFVQAQSSLGAGEAKAHDMQLPPGCYLMLAAADGGLDLDLYLLDAVGRTLDSDTSIHRIARVRLCLSGRESVQAIAKGYGTRGEYTLAVFRAPPVVDSVAALRMEEALSPLTARGFQDVETSTRAFGSGESTLEPYSMPAGECRAWAVAGAVAVRDVDLFLKDQDGTVLASASGPEPFASLYLCADEGEARSVVLETSVYAGRGTLTTARLRRVLQLRSKDTESAGEIFR